jgi:hypothetical protein
MTVPTPTRQPGDPIPPPEPPYPWKVGVGMAGLVALVLVVAWLAFQVLKGPPTAGQFPSPATATAIQRDFEATVSAADTARPRPTPRPPTPAPTVAPTTAPAALAAPTAVRVSTPQPSTTASGTTVRSTGPIATPVPAAAGTAPTEALGQIPSVATEAVPARTTTTGTAGVGEPTTVTAAPTVAPELVQQISDSYRQYWQVKADAFYSLDASTLSQVAVGQELSRLQQQIADDQANGRAMHVTGHHDFTVLSAENGQAQVADDYRDLSVAIDPVSHDPLPGQAQPQSVDSAPEFKVVYDLQFSAGTWKVSDGVQLVAEDAR